MPKTRPPPRPRPYTLALAAALPAAWAIFRQIGRQRDARTNWRAAYEFADRERTAAVARERLARRDAAAAHEARDELLSLLGHELRNPLNALVTSAEVLRVAPTGSDLAKDACAVVSRQTRKLSELVDRLLEASRVMSGDLKLNISPVDLQALLRASVAGLMPRAFEQGRHITLHAPRPVWVNVDAARIAEATGYLLDNALRYTPREATITLELYGDGADALVAVTDTGPGIDPALLSRIFEPFTQGPRGLDRSGGGLGVGLTLVKRLIELHGGSVAAHSSPRGSVFSWRLPTCAALEATSPAAPPRRIGVVDDNPDALASMRSMLELAGHDVHTATDGPGAVAMLLAERPDVALVDIGLPGFDGYEIARRCRRAGFRGRLIAVSGYGLLNDLARSRAEGFEAHLIKPVNPAQLLPLLDE